MRKAARQCEESSITWPIGQTSGAQQVTSLTLSDSPGERGIWRIPGILGAFTKRMKSRYERDFWPFSWRKDEEGRFWYSMPAPVAAKIRSFRQAA